MKYLLSLLIVIGFYFSSFSQCTDVFGRAADCPDANDSLVVYNNALKVYEFYEKNPDYVKLKSVKLTTKQSVRDCFYQLQDAVDSFQVRWQLRERVLKGEDIPKVLLPRDGKNIPMSDYYVYIDAYHFYQRELENGILNTTSPFPVYDIRIAPLVVNSYENRFGRDGFNGDFVNVALYIPVTVKPYAMLTDSEKVVREQILSGNIPKGVIKKKTMIATLPPKPKTKKQVDTTRLESANIELVLPFINKVPTTNIRKPVPWDAMPMYYQHPAGAGWLMGWMIGRKFRKFSPGDEFYSTLPKWMVDFLNDDIALEKYLRIKWGGYYNGLYID
jgi:hypothetical protein